MPGYQAKIVVAGQVTPGRKIEWCGRVSRDHVHHGPDWETGDLGTKFQQQRHAQHVAAIHHQIWLYRNHLACMCCAAWMIA